MSPATTLVELVWLLVAIAIVVGVFVAPFLLYQRYRRLYGDSDAFRVTWSEQAGQGAFREGEVSLEQRVRVTHSGEWAAKIGFFLGIVGFLWTPIVLLGAASDLTPMRTVGLPGLVVSWSVFFAARGLLKRGPAAAPLIRFAATAEILVNVWVVALIVLCSMQSAHLLSASESDLLRRVLLVRDHSSDMKGYQVAYSLDQAGFIAALYATLSFFHAGLLLRAWGPLEVARRIQLRGAATPA